ncbi:MAG TPA: hypothetical protein VLA16_23365 [Ideonella sp.]|nr:hypothetical protein [Ideonella sp.]
MDVFFYWKDFSDDLKPDQIGWFKSHGDKLAELQDGAPDYLWVFKTPKGLKGQVQLMARLRWVDTPVVPVPRAPGESRVFYDPGHADSVRYLNSGEAPALAVATDWVRRYFPVAVRSNFQGANGQHALRGPAVQELNKLAKTLAAEPFLVTRPA